MVLGEFDFLLALFEPRFKSLIFGSLLFFFLFKQQHNVLEPHHVVHLG